MSVTPIGSTTSGSSAAQVALEKAQQKLADDVAAKAAEKVITADKVAVEKSRREVTQERVSSSSVDITV
jgi:hypothetical protein